MGIDDNEVAINEAAKIATKLGVALVVCAVHQSIDYYRLNATATAVILSSSFNRAASNLRSSSEFIPTQRKKSIVHKQQATHREERH